VDGSWTVTGARGADGKELPPIQGRGFELVQEKRDRHWRFIATREMVLPANFIKDYPLSFACLKASSAR
jgi:hypothetical protein